MKIAVLAFPKVQMLDLVGPIDVFAEAARQLGDRAAYTFEIVSAVEGPLVASNGMRITPDATLRTSSADIDTLLIAGSSSVKLIEEDPAIREWLHRYSGTVRRLASVCSGAMLLANAGLLDGKRVTTHWNETSRLSERFPSVHVEPDQIYVKDGNLYTSAGVTAGLDLALAMVEEDFGRPLALKVAREFVMFLKRPGGQSQFSTHLAAQVAQKGGIRDVQDWILENLSQPLSVEELAARAGMSTRNFARIFKRESKVTPAEFVERARVEAARRLLEDSRSPLKRVAAVTGFNDPNGLRRAFMRQMRVSPAEYRERFQSD